ncbi:dethiobiotin synthase [Xanthobacter sp. TB0139]|uniref:dethiobiotin synthase n=1 Tax=Xanthobacter sp. TB0139 TaxID=3459178 RepID=UPI00403A1361
MQHKTGSGFGSGAPAASASRGQALVVTGTDTEIGKTVFSAGLTGFLDAMYWKPVQSGLEEQTDSETVARLSGLPASRILPEAWRLRTPASPHLSARLDGVAITPETLEPPETARPLVIEGAGGLMVPLTDNVLFMDVFARWRLPLVLCARAGLGTINHTLLSLEALRARSIPVLGVALIGEGDAENARMIAHKGHVKVLGHLPRLEHLDPSTLRTAFEASFSRADFLEGAQ